MSEVQKRYRYPGIRSFSKEDERIFFGRSADTENIYASIHLNAVTTVFGQSGIGKTSVMNAGIITRFEKYNAENKSNKFSIIKVETGNYIPANNKDANRKTLVEIIAEKCFINAASASASHIFNNTDIKQNLWLQFKLQQTKNTPIVLIFDQAEQLFTFPTEDFNLLLRDLKSLTSKYVPDEIRSIIDNVTEEELPEDLYNHFYAPLEVKLVFIIRSDKLQLLSRFKNIIPGILQNCYEILPFNFTKAKEAINAPSQFDGGDEYTPEFTITDEATAKILSVLASKNTTLDNPDEAVIEPYYLQIICQHIEREIVKNRENIEVYEKDLPQNLADIVGEYYLTCIENLKLPETEKNRVQNFIEFKMIYEPDSRRITLDKAMIVSDKHSGVNEETLNKLVDERLFKTEKNISGGDLYELTHDCLVAPILAIKRKRSDEYAKIKQQGDLLVNQQKYDEAIVLYSNFIKNADSLDANFSEILKARGNVYFYQKNYKLSNKDLLDAIIFDPKDSLVLYYIGFNYFYLHDDENAEIYFDKAAQANTSYAAGIYNQAGVLYDDGKSPAWAEKYYIKAIDVDSGYSTSYYNLGRLYRLQKQNTKAIVNFNKALELDPKSADTYNELGNLYLAQDNIEIAQKNYENATALDSTYYYAWYNLGDIELKNNNLAKAFNYYQKAIDENPVYEDAYYRQAYIYLLEEKLQEAISKLEHIVTINPQSEKAYSLLGIVYANAQNYDNALKNLNIAISMRQTAESFYYLGLTNYEMKNLIEAEKNYKKTLELDPDYILAIEQLGRVLNEQKKNDESIALLGNKIEKGITSQEIYLAIADAYFNTADYDKAREYYLNALAKKPDDKSVYINLAELEKACNNLEKSLDYYNEVIKNIPQWYVPYKVAGNILYDLKEFDKALPYLLKVTELQSSASAFNDTGNCYLNLQDYNNAKLNYSKALEKDSQFFHSIYNLGLVEIELKNNENALQYFEKTIEMNPEYEAAYKEIANIYIAWKEYEKAISEMELLASKYPTKENYLKLGSCYFDFKNDFERAKEFYLRVIEKDANSDIAYLLAGMAETRLNNIKSAMNYYNKSIELNPQNADAYYEIGNIIMDENNFEDAIGYFEAAIKFDPNYSSAYNNLGHSYFNMNPFKKAEEFFKKSAEKDPSNYIAYSNIAETQIKLDKYDEALQNALKAVSLKKDYDEAYYLAATAYDKLGNINDAITNYKKCIELNSTHEKAKEQLEILEKRNKKTLS